MFKKQALTNKGISVIEVVVGSALFATLIVAAIFSITQVQRLEQDTSAIIRTNYLLLEAVDVARIFRDTSYSTSLLALTTTTPQYIFWNSSAWEATTTPVTIDGLFYRTIRIFDVLRDVNDDIVSVGGTYDPGTVLVQAEIEWLTRNGSTSQIFETYLTDLYSN